jgi:hypothetical protein
MTEPARVGKYSKTIRALQEANEALGRVMAGIVTEKDAEIARLRAALTQFVAACETAPPTSLMIEIGMACKVARAALSNGMLRGENDVR